MNPRRAADHRAALHFLSILFLRISWLFNDLEHVAKMALPILDPRSIYPKRRAAEVFLLVTQRP